MYLPYNPEAKKILYRPEKDANEFKRATKVIARECGQTGTLADNTDRDFFVDLNTRMEWFYVDCFYVDKGKTIQWSPELNPNVDELKKQ